MMVNIKPEVALAFGTGISLGSIGMALIARKGMRDLVKLTDRQSYRQRAKVKYLLDKVGPHLTNEELKEIITYMEVDLMASYEDGIELGLDPKDDTEN